MAFSPVEIEINNETPINRSLTGEEVVISGISGLFPKSDSVSEFMDNLYNKVDMVSNTDMHFDHPEAPKHFGKITGIRKFDAQFFRVTFNQAHSLEPMSRKLMENAYSAIYDSGINPLEYQGKKVGVFVGASYMDSGNISLYNALKQNGFIISGASRTMCANRISYWLDCKAPSYSIDCNCSSAMVCLEDAYNCIKTGVCDAAIVAGCQLCIHPILSLNLKRSNLLCLDGKTKCFDKFGDGYVRSEAISVLFLQKAKDAKRIYSEIFHSNVKYGLNSENELSFIQKSEDIEKQLKDFYQEAGVSPKEVEYVEANASAIAEADANELKAIGNIFGNEKRVMVGSVKSNMGNSEPASGVCSITKVCLAYHKGKLAANLHYSEPLDIPAVQEGKVEILSDHAPFGRGFTAVNNFSNTGINCHVLLKGHYKPKDVKRYHSTIPRLVLVSGRHENAVGKIFNILQNQPLDPELIGMMHNIYRVETAGHTSRGYTILDTNDKKETISLSQSIELNQGGKRPLWLVYSGMGSQWASMGADLMRIPIFAAAIEKCRQVLEPKGVDIVRIITDPDSSVFDNILNCFVGIAAVQIGLTDILKGLGIVPDYIIGHSVGEMGCAYFDGCFSPEDMILSAYSRGMVSVESDFIKGSMAAVGLGYNDILRICPPAIDIACHNSSESSTISGPTDVVREFVTELMDKGIFAKEVPSAHIAYHSRYISKAAPDFIRRLREIIKKPVPRSEKWICTSLPIDKWDDPIAKYSSPEYHANNLLSPVFFKESASLIPSNAVVVEVAPHGLLQAILKRSHKECTHIPLTRRGHSSPVKFLFEAIGKLYQEGYNPQVDVLYPKIEFPVSTETPLTSHYVDWDHTEDWSEAMSSARKTVVRPTREFAMSLQDDEYKFIAGNIREGKILFPEAAVLFLVWETLAMYKERHFNDMSVIFSNVYFHTDIIIDPEETVKLSIVINKGNDYFEVTHNTVLFVSGHIAQVNKPKLIALLEEVDTNDEDIILNSDDIYKCMHLKGHQYEDDFQSILSSSVKSSNAKIKWSYNWVSFLDSLIQLNIFKRDYDGVSVPKIIKNLTINTFDHMNQIMTSVGDASWLNAQIFEFSGVTRCGGVEMRDVIFQDYPVNVQEPDVLETLAFISHNIPGNIEMETAIQIILQIVAENVSESTINVTELIKTKVQSLNNIICAVNENIPTANFVVTTISSIYQETVSNSNLLIMLNTKVDEITQFIQKDSFLLTLENNEDDVDFKLFSVISNMKVKGKNLTLWKKTEANDENVIFIPISHEPKFSWIPRIYTELQKTRRVVIVSERQPRCGLLGLIRKIKNEFKNKIAVIIIDDYQMTSFDPAKEIFQIQLKKKLIFNIYKKGQWGGYYYLPTPKAIQVETNFNLSCTVPGYFDSLKWIESQTETTHRNEVQVYFAGPSGRDIQKVVNIVNSDNKGLGMDFSGIDAKGNRVMGLVPDAALSSIVLPNPDLLWPVPNHWSLEEAATVPLPYVLACYCLTLKGQLRSGQSVFVNGGAGPLGQAVISICLSIPGCSVYTSVGDVEKKRFLLRLFPQLDENNIGYSHDYGFYINVVTQTKNNRCTFVISCITGPLREFSMKCTAQYGYFLDLSSYDMKKNIDLGMFYLEEDRTYKAVNISSLFMPENVEERKLLQKVISDGIVNGFVKPISHVVYSVDNVPRAFRLLSLNKNRGRILIKVRDLEAQTKVISTLPRISYSPNDTQVVVCDNTELGIELANRLIKRGARNIVLHMKSKKITGYMQTRFALWHELGATIRISTESLQSENDCVKFIITNKGKTGAIHGIFYVQESFRLNNYSQEEFIENENKIVSVIANLDFVSRNNCPELRYFVVITRSSENISDEYMSSALDKICQARTDVGLPGLVLRCKTLQEKPLYHQDGAKVRPQNIQTVLNALEASLKHKYKNVLTYDLQKCKQSEYLNKIARIIGVININKIDENLLVKDIVSNEVNIEELKAVIKDVTNNDLTAENIKEITIARLKSLNNVIKKQSTKFKSGLGAFYSYIDQDETVATDVLIAMPSLLSSLTEKEENMDAKATYLMLIPGFEGHHYIFNSICERLKIKAMTFQLGPDLSNNSIPEIALGIKQFMKKRFQLKSKFYLLGYSFGINVALELAALLEKEGLVGVVYCLDSSPDALRVQLDAYLGKLSEEKIQNAIIDHLFYVMSGQQNEILNHEINKMDNWSDKVELCVNKLKGVVTYTTQYERNILETAYKRIILARNYQPNFKLESELILLKGIPHPEAESLPYDYNLSKYTNKPVKVFDIKSDVAGAPQDCRVSNIINQMLDPELLENYKTTNLCETYLSAPFKVE